MAKKSILDEMNERKEAFSEQDLDELSDDMEEEFDDSEGVSDEELEEDLEASDELSERKSEEEYDAADSKVDSGKNPGNENPLDDLSKDSGKINKKTQDNKKKKKEDLTLTMDRGRKIASVVVILAAIFLALVINSLYFSKNKMSELKTSNQKTVFQPVDMEYLQSFYSPSDNVTGFVLYFEETDGDKADDAGIAEALNEKPLHVWLDSDEFETIADWNITSSMLGKDGRVELPLNGVKMYVDSQYYFHSNCEEGCKIGIVAYRDAPNGYGSTMNDDYVWAYQIVYNPLSRDVIIIEVAFIISILVILLLHFANAKKTYMYYFAYLAISLMFLIYSPFGSADNEIGHIYRAYEISKGSNIAATDNAGKALTVVPGEISKGVNNVLSSVKKDGGYFVYQRQYDLMEHALSEDMTTITGNYESIYSPIMYIPQALGMFIGGHITKNVYLFLFIGRFLAYLVNVLLVIFAMKLLPDKRRLIMLVAGIPSVMCFTASYSMYGLTISLAIFFISYIMYVRNKGEINHKDNIIISLCVIFMALSSPVYLPFILIIFLMPDDIFDSNAKARVYKYGIVGCALVLMILWTATAVRFMADDQMNMFLPEAQGEYLLKHIYMLPIMIVKSFYKNATDITRTMFGGVTANGAVKLTGAIWLVYMIVVLLELLVRDRKNAAGDAEDSSVDGMDRAGRVIAIVIAVVSIIILSVGMYLLKTPYRSEMISGIKGYMLIPLIPVLDIAIDKKLISGVKYDRGVAELIVILILNMCTIINMYSIYV